MPLSDSWVNRIHARLLVRYGAAWIRMWEGIDPDAVKADWAEELAGFTAKPDAIRHALDNLPPDKPPTVAQFRDACNKAPNFVPPALPAPKPDPAVAAAVLGAIKPPPGRSPKFWAYELRDKERAGARLTITQKAMLREALKYEFEGFAA